MRATPRPEPALYGAPAQWLVLAMAGLSLTACGDDAEPSAECGSAMERCGDEQEGTTLLGRGPAAHTGTSEATNAADGDLTTYVLESARGLAIEETFEAAPPTADSFVFNSGALGT